MIILRNNLVLALLLSLLLAGCSVSKRMQKDLQEVSGDELYFKGISVLNANTGETLLDFNGDKFFTPASNVKLFTLYTAWKTLQDSIASFDYVKTGDSLILRGTANPLFLSDSLHENALKFLSDSHENIYLKDEEIEESVYGAGWSWDDYPYAYMPEKHLFPIFGNVISIDKTGDSVKVTPDFFQDKIHLSDNSKSVRARDANEFNIEKSANFADKKVPFKTSNQLVADLLSNELNRKVILIQNGKAYDFKAFSEVPYDTLYTRMMVNSDNFMAEQLMLRVGYVTEGRYSVSQAIKYSLEHYISGIPHKPRWVDGSGLSRYNMFSPKSISFLLKRMYDEIPQDQLFAYLPQGGVNGTIKNNYTDQPYIHAKSGSLSNNYSLSGYLTTKKGQVLIFSYMNNHFPGSSLPIKKEISDFLKKLHESY
jgi:D-alanyl-D-alanine carboxypeptidase/D-alanyl-D-alanine-endopeptidase (penicillin-binding protein 4)